MGDMEKDTVGLIGLYQHSLFIRIITYVVLFFAAIFFGRLTAADYAHGLSGDARVDFSSAIACITVIPAFMLGHNFLYDRQSFYWTIPVGIIWIFFGDVLAVPFWMATFGLILSLITQFRVELRWKILVWFVALYGYTDIYSFAPYLLFYGTCIVLTPIAWKITSDRIAAAEPLPLGKQLFEEPPPENEQTVSSFRPPRDEPDEPKPAPKPEPKIVSSYRPPRDAVEDESPNTILVAKTAPVKKVFRPAKDDYAGLLLMLEKKTLPAAMQTELQGIIKNARMILTSMEEDPEDVKPGNAFLSRYMPALESVVEQVEKLAALESLSSSSKQAMDKCFHALQGLRSAFAQQYEQLQENNQLKFNVEMEMLDSLLKTDGFK